MASYFLHTTIPAMTSVTLFSRSVARVLNFDFMIKQIMEYGCKKYHPKPELFHWVGGGGGGGKKC